MTSLALSFNDVNFSPIQHEQQIWLTASELAKALGYAKSDAVTQVYERNKDEFNPSMTLTLKLSVKGFGSGNSEKDIRVFSPRGCHLIAIFSKTAVAKQFRKWVLDVLDKEVGQAATPCKSTSIDREDLRHAVSNLVSRARISFSDAYKMVWQRFGVSDIGEIPVDELSDAVEYVHGLILTFDKAQQYSPVNIDAIQDCCGVLQYRLIEYHTKLEDEVKRLGGKMPEYPSYNPEEVVQALMSRILQGKQMVLNLNFQGGFTLNLVPRDALMVDSKNIPELVSRTDLVAKEQLPLIMQNAMNRLVK